MKVGVNAMYEKEYILDKSKTNENEKRIVLCDIFDNVEVEIEGINYLISDKNDQLEILLKSETIDNKGLETMFFCLYVYISVIVGYYPELVSGTEFNVKYLAQKYKTQERYIKNDVCFIEKITTDDFKESYKNFLELLKKISFQLDYYSIAISTQRCSYPEITIVNILQCLDGIYDYLQVTSENRVYFNKKKAKEIKENIKNINVKNLVCAEKTEKLEKQLKDAICRIECYNYNDKLEYLFNYIDYKYNIFKLEKNTLDENDKLEQFIDKCKKTRNKFSHALNSNNNCLNGIESGLYLEKLVLVFRLLIIDEIKLDKLINIEKLNCLLFNINEWLTNNLCKVSE